MQTVDRLEVYMNGIHVGTIAPYLKYRSAFEYSDEWLQAGFSISPFSLPLEAGVKIAEINPFDGLFGVFSDSLPDGWGRLLVDRMLRKEGEDPDAMDSLTRLSIVGDSGLGALEYRPAHSNLHDAGIRDYDRLAAECKRILQSEESDDLDTLYALGGSSGGARPKVMLNIDGEDWIVKFPSSQDPKDIGLMEYEYTKCAAECGIEVPEIKLFPSKVSEGYFGCKRFDREEGSKVHMASVSALLETSHRMPSLDYKSLMALTWQLTKNANEMEKMYALMCFNVFAHNRDDHSNNFSFLCSNGKWRLSPAYDLTYSNSVGGEHATTIAGEGANPGIENLLKVAEQSGMNLTAAGEIAEKTRDIVNRDLKKYL